MSRNILLKGSVNRNCFTADEILPAEPAAVPWKPGGNPLASGGTS